jgi:hypothetical protein
MRNRHRLVLLVPAAFCVAACALYFPHTPILPEAFEGPLSASADSLVASTLPSYCAPVRHLDFGTTPQGCVRGGEPGGWINWTGTGHVVTVGREWIQPDVVTALRVGRPMESELAGRLGLPVECHYARQWTEREVRWIATEPAGISTALIVWGSVPRHTATPRVILIRTLGPELCGDHRERPANH